MSYVSWHDSFAYMYVSIEKNALIPNHKPKGFTMLTTDFTGTYDYEKEEAEHAARYILDELNDAYITPEELGARIHKELAHWKKCIPDTFEDFERHFNAFIDANLEHALKGYQVNA